MTYFEYGMRVIAAQAHPHITTGLPCTCPWGARRLSNIAPKTASKIQWLEDRMDKFMRTPEGAAAYNFLKSQVNRIPKLDDLAPWLWREIKKGRIEATANGFYAKGGQLDLNHLADWYGSNSPTRRGTDVMQLDVDGLNDRIQQWNEELASKMEEQKQMHGTVVHDFSDPEDPDHPWNGWTVRRVDNAEQAKNEGDAMGHCVGGYGRDIENGDVGIYSLRDPKNQPHATIELRPGTNSTHDYIEQDKPLLRPEGSLVHQIQGKQNVEPEEHYKEMLRDWFGQVPGIGANIDKTTVPAPDDPHSLSYWYEPTHDESMGYGHYQLDPYQADDYGLGGDEDEFEYEGPPKWDQVINNLLHSEYGVGKPHYGVHDADNVATIAHDTGNSDEFLDAAEKARQELGAEFYHKVYDPNEYLGSAPMQWNRWHKGQKMNTLTGVVGYDESSLPYDKDGIPLDQAAPPPQVQRDPWEKNFQPQLDEELTGDLYGKPGFGWKQQSPPVFSKVAAGYIPFCDNCLTAPQYLWYNQPKSAPVGTWYGQGRCKCRSWMVMGDGDGHQNPNPQEQMFDPRDVEYKETEDGTYPSWQQKTTADMRNTEFYHVAPAEARESIQQRGLIGHEGTHDVESPWADADWETRQLQPHGNYLYQHPEQAMEYAYALKNRHPEKYPSNDPDAFEDRIDYGHPCQHCNPDGDPQSDEDYERIGDCYHCNGLGYADLGDKPAWDIWKVNIDPDRQTVMADPETSLLHGELSQAEALHRFQHGDNTWAKEPVDPRDQSSLGDGDDTTNLRWYTPHHIGPDQLELHRSVAPGELGEYSDSDENLDWSEPAYEREVPYGFAQVPFVRHFGRKSPELQEDDQRQGEYQTPEADVRDQQRSTHSAAEGSSEPTGGRWSPYEPNPDGSVKLAARDASGAPDRTVDPSLGAPSTDS